MAKIIRSGFLIVLLLCLIAAQLPFSAVAEGGTPLKDLRVNGEISPINVGEECVFSWKLDSTLRNVVQTAYRVRVGSAPGGSDLWDSGKIDDYHQSVSYGGAALASATKYYWSVTVWDGNDGFESASSTFETALFPSDITGRMVACGDEILDRDNYSVEADVRIENATFGLIIGGTDVDNFVAVQVNIKTSRTILRCIYVVSGSTTKLKDIDVTSQLSRAQAQAGFHIKVDVTEGGVMSYYIDGVYAGTATHALAVLNGIGLRQMASATDDERVWFDNICVKSGTGQQILLLDFADGTPTGGTVTDGELYVVDLLEFYDLEDLLRVRSYSMETDITIQNHGAGVIIGALDASNYVCAQINIKSDPVRVDFIVATNGTAKNKQKTSCAAAIPYANRFDTFHFKAVVTTDGTAKIYINNTYICSYQSELCVMDRFGFRQWYSASDNEIAQYDNLTIITADGKTLVDFDFSGGYDPFDIGTVTDGKLTVQNFTGVFSPDVIRPYVIDTDFAVEAGAFGLSFSVEDSKNFLFWQVNITRGAANEKIYLNPHTCIAGTNSRLANVDITSVLPWTERNDTHHIRVEISPFRVIKTYINSTLVDTRTVAQASFSGVGFRQNYNDEKARVDNYVLTDLSSGTTLISGDFNDHTDPFSTGRTKDGKLVLDGVGIFYRPIIGGAPLFRKEFSTIEGKTVASARLYATALGVYEAWLDGVKAGDEVMAPGSSSYSEILKYQCIDVTSALTAGSHALCAAVGDGWYLSHFGWGNNCDQTWGVEKAFLAQLVITYTDGTMQTIVTDDTWKTTDQSPFIITDNQNGETYDARLEQDGWMLTGFDDSDWKDVKLLTAGNSNTKVDPHTVSLEPASGKVICEREITPVAITRKGDVFIVDMGQNFAGVVRLDVTGTAGQTVRLRYGEILDNEGDLYTDNLRTAFATDYYTFKDSSPVSYMPRFTYHGFRYVEVAGLSSLTASEITGIVQTQKMSYGGSVRTGSELLNQIFSNTLWSQRSNFFSIPTDCPQRDERRGWTGDAHIFARTAAYNSDIYIFMKDYLDQLRLTQRPNGCVATFAPNFSTLYGNAASAGWGDAAVILPWVLYTEYGDVSVLSEYYDMMKGWTSYQISQTTFETDGKYILPTCTYGDWLSIGETSPKDVVATQFLIYTLSLMEKTATVLGETSDAATYSSLLAAAKADFIAEYVSAGRITGDTQTIYVLALKFDIDPSNAAAFAARLAEKIVANGNHLTCGFMGLSYLCPMLSKYGYSELAHTLALQTSYPSWGYSIANGATTIWEAWDACVNGVVRNPASASFNHYSYGSVVEWMYESIGGISADESDPGYHHILLNAEMDARIGWASVATETPYGTVSSRWSLDENGCFIWKVCLPPNTTATICLPENVRRDEPELFEGAVSRDGKLYLTLGSGAYTFTDRARFFTIGIDDGTVERMSSDLSKYKILWRMEQAINSASWTNDPDVRVLEYGIHLSPSIDTLTQYIKEVDEGTYEGGYDGRVASLVYASSETGLLRVYSRYSFLVTNVSPGKARCAAAYIRYTVGGETYEDHSAISAVTTMAEGYINGIGSLMELNDFLQD